MADLGALTRDMGSPDYEVVFDEISQKGVIRNRLDTKLVEVRGYHINWDSYLSGQMISMDDHKFISEYDKARGTHKDKVFTSQAEQGIKTMLSLLSHTSKSHVIEYTLVLLDDLINQSHDTVNLIHQVASKYQFNVWSSLVGMLTRSSPVVMHMSSRLLGKLATMSSDVLNKVRCPHAELLHYLTWLKEQLTVSNADGRTNEFLNSVAECIQLVMRVDDYRMPFVKVDGINSLVSVLLSNCGFQLQYQLIFSMWLLSFQPDIAEKIGSENVIPVLSDILRNSQKEKVTRIIIATFRNLLEKPDNSKMASVSLIQSKLLPTFEVLSVKTWGDEDIKEDIEFITQRLSDSVQGMSTWDEYVAEVKSGRLEWSPVHRQQKFWRENAINICENNYELLKLLVRSLQISPDPLIQAIACHDLGEFIRHYPRARAAFEKLGCKELVMSKMAHENPDVKYEALLAVQKMLVQNWQFLGKGISVE